MTFINPICVALDTPNIDHAADLVKALSGHVGLVKIGMEFFYAHGATGYRRIAELGVPVFLDLKLHDIPNTVAQGLTSLLSLAPRPAILNVHATGGFDMMKAARAAVPSDVKLIAVTILTSLSNENIWAAGLDAKRETADHALSLAKLTNAAGLDGVVCSPLDLKAIYKDLPKTFLTIVPGIRPAETEAHDQKRIATPEAAMADGADILVIGRAITGAADPVLAAKNIAASI